MRAKNSKSSGKAASVRPMDGKTFQFEALPDELAKQIFTALPIKEKAALARTSKRYHRLFSQHIPMVSGLVAHFFGAPSRSGWRTAGRGKVEWSELIWRPLATLMK